MTAPYSGWYPDPSGAPQMRWWDGIQWTSHVAPPAPAPVVPSMPPPPTGPPPPAAAETAPEPPRVAPGDAPPGTVLFDAKISGVGVSSRQLRITPEAVTWGKTTLPLDQVTGVAFWVVKHTTNGVPSGTERFFVLDGAGETVKVPLHSNKLNPSKKRNEGYFDQLVEISEQLIEPRLCATALATIAAGGSYTAGPVTLDQGGIRTDARPKQAIAWSAVDEAGIERGYLQVGGGGGKPIPLSLHVTNAMVVARLVPVCAERFG